MAGRNQSMAPMSKKLTEHVDPDEPSLFLDHVCLGCTQRECKANEDIVINLEQCSNHEFLLPQLKNYQVLRHGRKCEKVR